MKTEYDKCLNGESFNGSDAQLVEMTLKTKHLLKRLNEIDFSDNKQKEDIFREMFGCLGRNVHIDIDFHCEYGKNIFIGSNVIINMNCTFVDNNKIEIGNNVLIASNVQIYTATHSTEVKERIIQDWNENSGTLFCNTFALPVKIENNVWIGAGSILLPNVTIGENSVIGAGSIVNKDIPSNCLAVGNPCKVIRKVNQ